jgi:cytoskeleton protein RodZ
MTERLDDDMVVAPSSPGVGERLQEARQAKKYTVAEVAAQLRLTKDIVIYLETQQWDKLHGRTYARGYFASYVKFLGLPFDEMLAVFNLEYTATEPALNLMPHGSTEAEKHFPWLAAGVVAVILLVIWLAFQQWQKTQQLEQDAATEMEQSDPEVEDAFSSSVVKPINNSPAINSVALIENVAADRVNPEPADVPVSNQDDLEEILATETMSPAAGPELVAQTETTTSEVIENSALQLSFTDECWVEVSNTQSKVLVSKIMRADESLELNSKLPLNILLGRASAVTVTFNNKPVDLSPYVQGDVARLTLGVES